MYKNIKVEAENLELILENSHGDKVIIPANKRNWVKQKLSENCHDCIDGLVETLPVASQYAQDGTLIPRDPNEVLLNVDGEKWGVPTHSPTYHDVHERGAFTGKVTDGAYDVVKEDFIYPGKELEAVPISGELTDLQREENKLKEKYEEDWYIDNKEPKFARSLGVSKETMSDQTKNRRQEFIQDELSKKIIERTKPNDPTIVPDKQDRLDWYDSMTDEEREYVTKSNLAKEIVPAIRQNTQRVADDIKENYSVWEQLTNPELSSNLGNALADRGRLNMNSTGTLEDWVNPATWLGGMAGGLMQVPKNIQEGEIGEATANVATPILAGIMGGAGAKTSRQFINNMVNPLAGVGTKSRKKVVDNIFPKQGTNRVQQVLNKTDDIFKSEIVTPEGFKNKLFRSNIQLEGPNQIKPHISEKGYNYRVLSEKEIESIKETKGVFPREGKQKGGNKNVKYWTEGNEKNWYGDSPDLETIRVKSENFHPNKIVRSEDVEVFDKVLNQWKSLGNKGLNKTDDIIQTLPNKSKQRSLLNYKKQILNNIQLRGEQLR